MAQLPEPGQFTSGPRASPSQGAETLGAPPAAEFHLGYRPWLDGLRGVAILLVLAFHLEFLPGGSLGVDVFFVLSGFLITTLLAEEWQRRSSISLKHFYLRRGLRLLPAFLVLLVICSLTTVLFGSGGKGGLREVFVAACYVANWPALHGTGMPRLGHTWSLSVEEQFYLFWPILLVVLLRLRLTRQRILLVVCAGILFSASLRALLYSLHRDHGPEKLANIMRLYMGSDTRADSLLVGCLAGLLACWGWLPRSRRFIRAAGAGSVLSAAALAFLAWKRCLDHSQYYHGLFTAVAVMVALIIVRLLSAPSRIGSILLESAPLVGAGRISYGLYLFHIPVIYWLKPEGLGWSYPVSSLVVAGLTLAAALLSYFCIERPCLRLKDQLGAPGQVSRPSDSNRLTPSKAAA